MRNLLNYAKTIVSVTYTIKYLLSSIVILLFSQKDALC